MAGSDADGLAGPEPGDSDVLWDLTNLPDDVRAHWSDAKRCWIIFRWNDVIGGLLSGDLSSARPQTRLGPSLLPEDPKWSDLSEFYSQWLMYQDPPAHTRLRAATWRSIGGLSAGDVRKSASRHARSILDEALRFGRSLDVVRTFAEPVALKTILELLGADPSAANLIRNWSHSIVATLGDSAPSSEVVESASTGLKDLRNYFGDRRHRTGRSVHSAISRLERETRRGAVSGDEAFALLANLVVDGYEPIASVVSTLIYRQILGRLGSKEIDEVLALNSPFQYCSRIARTDTDIGGVELARGEKVLLHVAAANRGRGSGTRGSSHLAFGHGRHYCVGATIARNTALAAVEVFNSVLPGARLAGGVRPFEWRQSQGYCGLESLHVQW